MHSFYLDGLFHLSPIHEWFMKDSWRTQERFMKDSWRIHEGFMKDSWGIHEGFMKDSWRIHEMNNKQPRRVQSLHWAFSSRLSQKELSCIIYLGFRNALLVDILACEPAADEHTSPLADEHASPLPTSMRARRPTSMRARCPTSMRARCRRVANHFECHSLHPLFHQARGRVGRETVYDFGVLGSIKHFLY